MRWLSYVWVYFLFFTLSLHAHVTIMGKAVCSEAQMRCFLLKNNPQATQYATCIPIYLEEGAMEGIRGDIAFAMSLHETGFFRFGGDVHPQQNNFAGLGATGGGEPGLSFKTPREGIRAQIQHLKAYCSKKPLRQSCVDPRFKKVFKRGRAPYVEDLGGLWAVPGYDPSKYNSLSLAKRNKDSYGDKIVRLWQEMQNIDKMERMHASTIRKGHFLPRKPKK